LFGGSHPVEFGKTVLTGIEDFISAVTPDQFVGAANNATPIVAEHVIYWCVQTINASMSNSALTEKVTNTQLLDTTFADAPWASASYYLPNFTLVLNDSQSPGGRATFGMSNITARTTYQALEDMVPSSWVNQSDFHPVNHYGSFGDIIFNKFSWRTPFPNPVKTVFPNSTGWLPPNNATQHVINLAQQMANVLRRTPVGDTGNFINQWEGDAWLQVTRVHIRWAWISLPLFLVLFSFVFLAATIIRSDKDEKKIGIWKSSALAILFNGLGDDVQEVLGTRTNLGHQRAKAKTLTVRLDD